MNSFYCFIAEGQSKHPDAIVLNKDDTVPQLLAERFPPAREYQSVTVAPDAWEYPAFGNLNDDGSNIDWNALWNAAFKYLVEKRGVSADSANAALQKTAANMIGTFVPITGKVTFGVPVEDEKPTQRTHEVFKIVTYREPYNFATHMFYRNTRVAIVKNVILSEPPPTESQIAEARKRIPTKKKGFGGVFVKRPELVFNRAIHDSFINTWNQDVAAALKGVENEKTDFPFYSAETAMSKLKKHVPYDEYPVTKEQVRQFRDLLTNALRAVNMSAIGEPEPKGIYNCFSTDEHQIKPFFEDILQVTNNEIIIIGPMPEHNNGCCAYKFTCTYYVIPAGKFYSMLNTLPQF
ncbi:hypothetical protein LJC56_08590 [Christensenellaceae bacterium OttesenSCG-928-K19]|nr:hypothetical protein [Christensenellaceae bacterium OttesenSCG-928-K19]